MSAPPRRETIRTFDSEQRFGFTCSGAEDTAWGRRARHEPRPPCISWSPCVCRALLPANWASDSEKVPEGHLPIIPREISPFSAACVPRSEHVINYVARGLVAESCSRQHRGR